MRVSLPLFGLRLRLAPLFSGPASPHGFCHRCERVSVWDDRTFRYRCRHCGGDPLEHAEAAYVRLRGNDLRPPTVARGVPEATG